MAIATHRRGGYPQSVQNVRDPNRIADRAERFRINAPELMPARDLIDPSRVVFESAGV